MLNAQERTDLELLIDKYGLRPIVSALVTICEEKAQHIVENWQDHVTAAPWSQCAGLIGKLEAKLTCEPYSRTTP